MLRLSYSVKTLLPVASIFALCIPAAGAAVAPDSDDFFTAFQQRTSKTQSNQPGWSIPLLGGASLLSQLYRQDITRPVSRNGTHTWNIGGGKGFNLIPLPNTEVDIDPPSYFQRSTGVGNGFGDFSMILKYRPFTANEKKGNYSSLVGLAISFPTASFNNGVTDAVLTPSLALGKGWKRFDVQTFASIALPTGNTHTLGRPVSWSTVAQYKVGKHFWPEIESGTIFYQGGANGRNVQSMVLPGVMSKFRLRPKAERSRLALVAGAGMQFAVTHFHTVDHVPVSSVRLVF